MRISDWSSDVCSSDLPRPVMRTAAGLDADHRRRKPREKHLNLPAPQPLAQHRPLRRINSVQLNNMLRRVHPDRQSVVEGKSVSVRVDLGGRRIIQKKKRLKRDLKENKENKRER